MHSGLQNRFWAQNAENEPKVHFWAQKCTFRKSDQKVNVRLDVTEREQGIPDSGPDSIHGRPGLLKHVAFSVPLHSNKRFWRGISVPLAEDSEWISSGNIRKGFAEKQSALKRAPFNKVSQAFGTWSGGGSGEPASRPSRTLAGPDRALAQMVENNKEY